MRIAAILFALVLASFPAHAGSGPGLVLNEIVAGPARDWNGDGTFSSRDDEWVELFNAAASSIDLAGYLLTDGDRLPRYAFSGTLGAGERRLVFGKDSYDWEKANGFGAYGLSLGNSGDTVMLWQVAGAETVLVDSYAYKSHEAAADRGIGRIPDGGSWTLLDGLDPYVGTTPPPGSGCSPTPGASNVCENTPVGPTTWGKLKALYR